MKRRDFITNSSIAGLGVLSTSGVLPSLVHETTRVTILHTNDMHSRVEPFPKDAARNAGMGGVARRSALIDRVRKAEDHVLLFDCGDIFQGTPYFNYYGGELEFKLMSMLQYDAATIGNHDFDNSIDGLNAQMPHANFDFISANYDFKNTVLDTHIKPYKTYIKDGIKVGVFGLGIELDGLVEKRMYKETRYLNPIEIAQDISRILKEDEQCDLVICLSHLGYYYKDFPEKMSDLNLARATKNIDLIIGGHTHTFLPKPTVEKNADGKNVLVNQVGCYGLYLGRIDFYFDADEKTQEKGTTIIV